MLQLLPCRIRFAVRLRLRYLAAAPGAALARNHAVRLPLHLALSRGFYDVAHALLAAWQLPREAGELLGALEGARGGTSPQLWVDVVCRLALTPEDWLRVPAGLPELRAALPAVLARSCAEAAQLMARLPAGDRDRVRTAALSLARAQRDAGVPLPPAVVTRLLGTALEA